MAKEDFQKKRWSNPLLLILVSDTESFRNESLKIVNESEKMFLESQDDLKTYKLFVNDILILLITFNRIRIADVQYLKINVYINDQRSNFIDFGAVLTETEIMLTEKYKRVLNRGKGSRAVVILIPEILRKKADLSLIHRNKYIIKETEYIFVMPG